MVYTILGKCYTSNKIHNNYCVSYIPCHYNISRGAMWVLEHLKGFMIYKAHFEILALQEVLYCVVTAVCLASSCYTSV